MLVALRCELTWVIGCDEHEASSGHLVDAFFCEVVRRVLKTQRTAGVSVGRRVCACIRAVCRLTPGNFLALRSKQRVRNVSSVGGGVEWERGLKLSCRLQFVGERNVVRLQVLLVRGVGIGQNCRRTRRLHSTMRQSYARMGAPLTDHAEGLALCGERIVVHARNLRPQAHWESGGDVVDLKVVQNNRLEVALVIYIAGKRRELALPAHKVRARGASVP